MIKIAIYIVTYKNEDLLHRCLKSVFHNLNIMNIDLSVTVMNNFGVLSLSSEWKDKVSVIDNLARPDFSTGHLSRSWNECIIHGFKSLSAPKCDLLILAQNDVVFEEGYLSRILEYSKIYTYMTFGRGDELQIMTPESVKTIGLYDERFCNIGYQEADYFLRALILNGSKSTINDPFHRRVHNRIENPKVIQDVPSGYLRHDVIHHASMIYHSISQNVFFSKWNSYIHFKDKYPMEDWDPYVKTLKIAPKQWMFYPYFEMGVYSPQEKYTNSLDNELIKI